MTRIVLAADPDIHRAAASIANRVVCMFRLHLRHGECQEALTQVYLAAREEMEALAAPADAAAGAASIDR